jgi:DNA-binding PadR family transcriptional regulator
MKQDGVLTHPPLSPAKYWMLLVLADGRELHGYDIKLEIKGSTGGRINLDPGSTYGYLKALPQSGLIDQSAPRWSGPEQASRRYYSLTDLGRQALIAEQRRIRELARDSHGFSAAVRRRVFYRSLALRGLLALAGIDFLWLLILVFRSRFGTEAGPSGMTAPNALQIIPAHFYLMMAAVVVVIGLTWRMARKATADELELYTDLLGRELLDPEDEGHRRVNLCEEKIE